MRLVRLERLSAASVRGACRATCRRDTGHRAMRQNRQRQHRRANWSARFHPLWHPRGRNL